VAIFGYSQVGQFAILSDKMLGAGRIMAIESLPSRLDLARVQGAEVIDFNAEHPVEVVRQLTSGIGLDRVIDAVGVGAERPRSGPAAKEVSRQAEQFNNEIEDIPPRLM